ncbi:MAG: hypothetical protein B6I32_03120, partial [Desulfobacterium sp. 4572_20]
MFLVNVAIIAFPPYVFLRRVSCCVFGAKEVHLVTRRSTDGGWNWEPIKDLFAKKGWDAAMGTATMDSSNGTAMVSYS